MTIKKEQNNTSIKTLSLSFTHPIYTRQIKRWRGAFIEMAGWEDALFHNHVSKDEYHYRYPLVQYRVRKGNAALFAMNEGVEALQKVLATSDWKINWDGEVRHLQIADLRMNEHFFRMLSEPKQYKVYKWLALNDANFEKWKAEKNLIKRVELLQQLLTNHIVATVKQLGFEPPERVEVSIEEIRKSQLIPYHESRLMAFDLMYSTNILLPTGLALGKGVSHGFGWTVPHTVKRKNTQRRTAKRKEKV